MSFNEASAPLATLTAIDNGKILSMFVYDGSEVGESVVRVVNGLPKVISPLQDDFLVNGMTILVGATNYTVLDVRMPESCYKADPVQNKAFREWLDFWQTNCLYDRQDHYIRQVEKCVLWIRTFNMPETGSPRYSRIIDELRDLCQGKSFTEIMTMPDAEEAIDDLEKRFYEHGYVPPRFSRLRLTAARYLPYGRAIARPVEASRTIFDNVSYFFECYRLYMTTNAAIRMNLSMEQRPLLELAREHDSPYYLRVYEGEPFSLPCSDRVFTAHTMRGVPVIRSEPVDGRPCRCMVVEGGYFKVEPDRNGEILEIHTRPQTLYSVYRVTEPIGIDDVSCDDKEFVELCLHAYGTVAERFETGSRESARETASFIRSKLLVAHIYYAASDLERAQAYLDEIRTRLASFLAENAL